MENIVFSRVEDILAKSAIEAAQRSADFDRKMEQSRAEFDRKMADLRQSQAETDRILRESRAELKAQQAETDRLIKGLAKEVGGMSKNNGIIAEEYFFNAFERGQTNFFNEKFYEIKKNLKGIETDDEFDVVMINGHSIGVVEVKYKAHENDLPQMRQKAEAFRINFPKYKNHRVYLGLASMAFYPKLEEECKKQGIAIIKQVGDKVIIYEENLKTF